MAIETPLAATESLPEEQHEATQNPKKRNSNDVDRKKDKRDIKRQRQMGSKYYETVVQAKKIWNVLREKKMAKDKRRGLATELFDLVNGNVHEIAAKHDASRVIQCLIQYCTPEQRSKIVAELEEHITELCKMEYGHFLVQKMLDYGSTSDLKVIVKKFTGHMVKLATHSVGANVVEFAFSRLKPSQISSLRLEFYGKEYTFFKPEGDRTLKGIIESHPDKKKSILKHINGILQRAVEKQLLGLAFVHQLLWDYIQVCDFSDRASMIESVRTAAPALLSTRYGANVVTYCLAYGSAMDRKRLIKSLKGKMLVSCNHPSGYLVLIRILDVVDDTVMVQKSVLSELLDHLFDIAEHKTGRKVLLHLLSPREKRYFTPDELHLLEVPMIPSPEDPTTLITAYKKDPEVRREELLKGLKDHLETMCTKNIQQAMISKFSSEVVFEVCRNWKNEELLKSIAQCVAEDASLVEHPIAHFFLQRVLAAIPSFGELLLEQEGNNVVEWCKANRGAFVVAEMLKANAAKKVKKILKPHLSEIRKLAEKSKGAEILLNLLKQK